MGGKSRNKGKVGEREFSTELNLLLGLETRRGCQFKGTPDSPDVVGWPGVYIEVKRREKINVDKFMAEAAAEAGDDIPLVATRRNRGEWLLTIKLKDLLPFAHEIIIQDRRGQK